ncbi:PspC domain-containing protein [Pseudonocardia sp. RS010]|uniref:PspC domain-containing protein n=1 Tax=Pseudonocardia sp. RS010 TaxID=3385979 RepID=UPI0039A0B574
MEEQTIPTATVTDTPDGTGSASGTGTGNAPGTGTPAGTATGTPAGTVAPGRPQKPFRLHRSRRDRMLAGVCGGLAESLGIDAGVVRIALVALTVLGVGVGVVLYLAAWILAPEE